MKPYKLDITWDNGWWMIRIPAIKGLTNTQKWQDIPRMAKEYILLDQDLPDEAYDQIETEIGTVTIGNSTIINTAWDAKIAAQTATEIAQDKTIQAAKTLTQNGISLRESGQILGLSHQRIAQLIA